MFSSRSYQKKYFSENRPEIISFVIAGVIRNFSSFLLSVSIGEFFVIYFQESGAKGKLLKMLGIELHDLNSFFLFFSVLIFIRGLFGFIDSFISTRQGEKFVRNLREEIFREQILWPEEKFKKTHYGRYLLRYTSDMKSVQNYLTRGILGGIRDGSFLIIGFILLILINKNLAFLFISLSLISLFLVMWLSGFQKRLIVRSRAQRNKMVSYVSRSFQRHARILERNREESTIERFNRYSRTLFKRNLTNHRFEGLADSALSVIQFAMILIILWQISHNGTFSISAGDALVFLLIILLMNATMKRVLKIPAYINKGKISLEKIEDIMNFRYLLEEEEEENNQDDQEKEE